jgi:hypothetical protein
MPLSFRTAAVRRSGTSSTSTILIVNWRCRFPHRSPTRRCRSRVSSRSGDFKLKRVTVRKRMEAKLQSVKQNRRTRMQDAVAVTGRWLGQVLNGYHQDTAIPGNLAALKRFRERTRQH